MRECEFRRDENAAEVYTDNFVPVGDGELLRATGNVDTGIVDENIDATEVFDCLLD